MVLCGKKRARLRGWKAKGKGRKGSKETLALVLHIPHFVLFSSKPLFRSGVDGANFGPHATDRRATGEGVALSLGGRDLGVVLFVTNRTFCSCLGHRARACAYATTTVTTMMTTTTEAAPVAIVSIGFLDSIQTTLGDIRSPI